MERLTRKIGGCSVPREPRGVGRLRRLLAVSVLLAGARCTFPEYDVASFGSGGTTASVGGASAATGNNGGNGNGNGAGGNGAGGGTAAQSGAAISGDQGGFAGTQAEGGSGGEGPQSGGSGGAVCAGEQWPVDRCEPGCLRSYADHCYDGDENEGETDVDCGGACQGCSNQACAHDSDCLSGKCEATTDGNLACHAPLTVSVPVQDQGANVGSTNFTLRLRNVEPTDGQSFTLSDLKLRYYFMRSGIVEPLQIQATQVSLVQSNGDSRTLSRTSWIFERVESVTDGAYDAYLEISLADSGKMFPGDRIDVRQQMLTGFSGSSNFDQRANYSFTQAVDAPWLHVTAFYRGNLVWGLEPRPANPRACLARAVNLNGTAVAIAGNDWQAASDAKLTTAGSAVTLSGATAPTTTGDLAKMLGTATRLQTGQELDWAVDNGSYLVYLDVSSGGTDSGASLFTLQGAAPASSAGFKAQIASANTSGWARLGPFRVSVTSGSIDLAVTQGAIDFSGIELWYPE